MLTGRMPGEIPALPETPWSDPVLTDHFASGAATVDELLAGAVGGGESATDEGVQHPVAPVGHQGAVPWELQLPPGWGGMQGKPGVRESACPWPIPSAAAVSLYIRLSGRAGCTWGC